MKFGELPLQDTLGCILAHSVRHAEGVFKKGRKLAANDLKLLAASNVSMVFVAKLDANDVPEDEAARTLAGKIAGSGASAQEPFTGRANVYAQEHGLVVVDGLRVNAINRVHESMTLATLPNYHVVAKGQMIATVKIIPFAVGKENLNKVLAEIGTKPVIRVQALAERRVGLVITKVAGSRLSLIEKSETAMRERVTALGSGLAEVRVCDHSIEAVRTSVKELEALSCNPILLFGASAIVDREDVIPAGLSAAGGKVVHLGMPVDPGNLMMLGDLHGVPVLGVPSCARSPKVNGFDWALERVLAGIPLSSGDIMDMGAGGLLAEISSRPSPRDRKPVAQHAPRIAAIVLAAGKSSRMGSNKLLAELHGKPLLRHSVEALKASSVNDIIVVTGNEPERVQSALKPLDVTLVHNANFAEGLSTSLKRGLAAVPAETDAVLICLGDMPLVDAQTIDRLVAAFNVPEHRTICVPTFEGKRGNPVLWGRQHFIAIDEIEGDQGARLLLDALSDEVVEVEVKTQAVLVDVDTPQALEEIRSALNP
ncbi:MAG: molybdopterin-binding/glycosyltransferase family 2 protein [Aestuariivirga sp.]